VSVAVSAQVCTWCLGDMRPLEGATSVFVCAYCGRAVSFQGKDQSIVPAAPPPETAPAVAAEAPGAEGTVSTAGAGPGGGVRAPRAA